jgi:hypothetical protein
MIFVVLALLAVALAQNFNTCPGSISSAGWCDCGPANSGIVIQQFFFSPNPPVPGQNITGSITAKDTYSELSRRKRCCTSPNFSLFPVSSYPHHWRLAEHCCAVHGHSAR